MPRPRKLRPFPEGIRSGLPVKFTSKELKGPKLGIVMDMCKYDDGVVVWNTSDSTSTVSVYTCVQTAHGDTLESMEKVDQ